MGIDINYQPDMFQVGQLAYNSASQQAANKMQLYRDQNSQRTQERNLQRAYELQDRDAQQQADWLNDSIQVAEKTANDLRSVYNPNNLTEPGRATWAELQGKLKAVQKQRAFLTPQAYADLMGRWIGDVEMSGMDNHVIKVPTVEEDFGSNAIDANTGLPVDWAKPPKQMFIRRKDAKGNVNFNFHDLTPKTSAAGGLKVDPVKDEAQAVKNLQGRAEDAAIAAKNAAKAEFNKKQAEQKAHMAKTGGGWYDDRYNPGPYPGIEKETFNEDDPAYQPQPATQADIDAERDRLAKLRGTAQQPGQAPQPGATAEQPVSGGIKAQDMTGGVAGATAPPLPFPTADQQTEMAPAAGDVVAGGSKYDAVGTVRDSTGEELQVIAYPIQGIPVHAVANKDGSFSLLEKGADGRWNRTKKIIDPEVTPTEPKQATVHDIVSALPKGDKDADLVRELLDTMVKEGSITPESWSPEGQKALGKLGGAQGPTWNAAMGIGDFLSSGVPPIRFLAGMTEEDLTPGGVYSGVMSGGKTHTAIWDGNQFIPLSVGE